MILVITRRGSGGARVSSLALTGKNPQRATVELISAVVRQNIVSSFHVQVGAGKPEAFTILASSSPARPCVRGDLHTAVPGIITAIVPEEDIHDI